MTVPTGTEAGTKGGWQEQTPSKSFSFYNSHHPSLSLRGLTASPAAEAAEVSAPPGPRMLGHSL